MKLKQISRLSAYARPEAHLRNQTVHGAIVTIAGTCLALTLLIYESAHFWNLHRTSKMMVDLERRHDLKITLDMVFPAVPCAVLSVDALDISGTAESDAGFSLGVNLHKVRLDANGKKMGGDEYHTPQSQHMFDLGSDTLMSINVPQAMKHVMEMEDEVDHHEGCHIHGSLVLRRVAGKIVISVHQQSVFTLLPQLLGGHHVPRVLNMTHIIRKVAFGPEFPGQINPLDGFTRAATDHFSSYKYFVKVVPTLYYSRTGRVLETSQYSVTEYVQPLSPDSPQAASLELNYDTSPIMVTINEKPPSLLHFLVRISAVVGGAFAVTGMVDRWLHQLISAFKQQGMLMKH